MKTYCTVETGGGIRSYSRPLKSAAVYNNKENLITESNCDCDSMFNVSMIFYHWLQRYGSALLLSKCKIFTLFLFRPTHFNYCYIFSVRYNTICTVIFIYGGALLFVWKIWPLVLLSESTCIHCTGLHHKFITISVRPLFRIWRKFFVYKFTLQRPLEGSPAFEDTFLCCPLDLNFYLAFLFIQWFSLQLRQYLSIIAFK